MPSKDFLMNFSVLLRFILIYLRGGMNNVKCVKLLLDLKCEVFYSPSFRRLYN